MQRMAAVILAGGKGERLGGAIKANLVIDGTRLLERVASRLADASPMIVAHGPLDPGVLGLSPGMVGIPDLAADYAGPLAGFAAAVAFLLRTPDPPELLVSSAVDLPFLPADYPARLLATIGDTPAAVASHGGQDYPTNAMWRLAAVAELPRQILNGTAPRSLRRLIATLGGVRADWTRVAEDDPFAGINTPAELAAAEARALRESRREG